MPLAVSIAAHSALMESAVKDFAAAVAAAAFTAPAINVYGNVHAKPLVSPEEIRQELVSQLTSPVHWTASMQQMAQAGVERFVEIGSGSVLTGLTKRIAPSAVALSITEPAHLTAL
jgi:[acyl-carrier-protein] S-malonyltransferase